MDGRNVKLEALAPDQLAAILDAAILEYLDHGVLQSDRDAEVAERTELLARVSEIGGAA